MEKPVLQKRIFWDVDFNKIDYQKSYHFVIERVFERGDVEDVRQVRKFYGDELIQSTLKNAKWIRYDIFVFVKNLFDLKPQDFRCYTQRQSTEIPWTF
jgi:hypothetical protein